jgi:hypothetical protein
MLRATRQSSLSVHKKRRCEEDRGEAKGKAGRPKEGGNQGARLNVGEIVVPGRGQPHTANG